MDDTLDQKPVKILLVDDKNENLVAMGKTLAPLKLEVVTALSGNQALKLMLEHDFAVVLLDVMMPDMNGFEVANLMHQNDSTKYIPIIFITALNKSEDYYIQGMEAGAIDYLYKPIEPIILLSKVRVFVDLYTIRNRLEKTISKLNDFYDQLQKNNQKLKQLSEEDALTGASNRRHFEMEVVNLMKRNKNANQQMALYFIDMDDFKIINDSYGHSTGDLVLRTLVQRIQKLSQAKDLLKGLHFDLIARLGGDEFAVVISNLSTPENAEFIAKKILDTMQEPFKCQSNLLTISVSIGIAIFPVAGESISQLMHCADTALYQAKAAGKNFYVLYKQPS